MRGMRLRNAVVEQVLVVELPEARGEAPEVLGHPDRDAALVELVEAADFKRALPHLEE